jgi:hypothetical protein
MKSSIAALSAPLARLTAYCLPGGTDAARGMRGIRTTQRGEIRSGPDARWNPFTAEEFVDATDSAFCWDAHMGEGRFTSVRVVDAYDHGHGRLVLKKGPIQLKKFVGPDVDKGELQRYLAYVGYCPAMIVHNPWLEFTTTGPLRLRVHDRRDVTGAFVDIDIDQAGRPLSTRAIRPMVVGKQVIPTPWAASGSETWEREGLRLWRRMEASWGPPDASFAYVRIELTSFEIVR